jgi:hypothetical protein
MNNFQKLWWQQVQSDHIVLVLLRKQGANPCHQLHYLQMVTEKLGKAHFWREGKPPGMSHSIFVEFLRDFSRIRDSKGRQKIADIFGFQHFDNLKNWIRAVMPLAYELQRMAPALAQNGPNPEYPWPHSVPQHAPATFDFDIWRKLTGTGHGHRLIQIIDVAVTKFPLYS